MTARCEDVILYRSLPVNGEHYKSLMQGQSIKSKDPVASKTIREHVLLGSKEDFKSQFISTTNKLDIALKYAVPVHTVISIDLQRYRESGGRVYDLSTKECFTENVPPMDGDISDADAVQRRLDLDFGSQPYTAFTKAMYEEAAITNWECCRLFSVRSREVLLEGEIPFHCVSVVKYTTSVESVLKLPHQPHKIPFQSFATSVISDQTCYANGDNGGLINVVLKDTNDRFLLKQAKRNSLKTEFLSSREMRSSIDLEFAAFDTYRRVAHYVPGVDIAVRDCIKITFRYAICGTVPAGACEDDDPVLNCLLIRCIKQPHKLLPVEYIGIPLEVVHASFKRDGGKDYEIADKVKASTLQIMQKIAKQNGDVLPPDAVQQCMKLEKQYYIRHLFPAEHCAQLFKGLAVDMLVGNIYAGGSYEKSSIAKSRTGNLYRLSADRALGNQIAESVNADRRDDSAGNLLIQSISVEARWLRIPMNTLCNGLLVKLRTIRDAVKANKEDFYSEAYRRLDLPYDVIRSIALHPAQLKKLAEYDDLFKRTNVSVIWKDYLLNRCEYLCFNMECLEVQSRNTDVENTGYVLEALHNLFYFINGHGPFLSSTYHETAPRVGSC